MHCKRLLQQGFTLLELMVTMGIVGIVAAIALPSMTGLLGGSQLTATSNQMVYSLQSARSEAIKRISTVALCPSTDSQSQDPSCGGNYTDGWIVYVDQNSDGVRDDVDELILQGEALSPAFSVTPDDAFVGGVLFSISGASVTATGVPVSGDIAVAHEGADERLRIRIAASGRIITTSSSVTGSPE